LPQRDSAGQQRIAAQNKSEEKRETSKFRHERVTSPSRLSQRRTGNGNVSSLMTFDGPQK
jgi:hypothetical protein